jgi:hypothetical protein
LTVVKKLAPASLDNARLAGFGAVPKYVGKNSGLAEILA